MKRDFHEQNPSRKMKAGLYIHVPFCIQKCQYCDFYSVEAETGLIDKFVEALNREIELYAEHPIFSKIEFQALFFGGGTPSLLSASQLDKISGRAWSVFHFARNIEFTIEANPETVALPTLRDFRSIGINRLSLGIQSFSDSDLQMLGRIHSAAQAIKSIQWAQQAGFDNLNLDLISAIPGQTISEWKENLERAIQFHPQHVSVYCLTLEPGTPLAKKISAGRFQKVAEETERDMYLQTIEILSTRGFRQYEISNFALPEHECRHNRIYWDGMPYLGLGPAAHSFWQFHRQWNFASLDRYLESIEIEKLPIAGQEDLSRKQQMIEFIYLSLRKIDGIDLRQFEERFQISFPEKFQPIFEKLDQIPDRKIFHLTDDHFTLTPNGLVLFDEICSNFTDEV